MYPVYPPYESATFWIRSPYVEMSESAMNLESCGRQIRIFFLSSDATRSSPVLYGEYSRRCQARSLYVSGKLPTYPFPKPTLTLTSHLRQNVGLGDG